MHLRLERRRLALAKFLVIIYFGSPLSSQRLSILIDRG